MKIYIVIGSTGEYSDREQWLVIAFEEKEKANEWAALASKEADYWMNVRRGAYHDNPPKGWSKHDPNMKMDYTGTEYYVEEVLFDAQEHKRKMEEGK